MALSVSSVSRQFSKKESSDLVELIPSSYQNASSSKQDDEDSSCLDVVSKGKYPETPASTPPSTEEQEIKAPTPFDVLDAFDVLTSNSYKNAKMKGLKVFTNSEIAGARSELEKRRREFWIEKAEQLSRDPTTHSLDKTTIHGMVDIAWTLRKTGMLETDARQLLHEENVLFQREELAISWKRKLGSQKKDTIKKNIDRMSVAHLRYVQVCTQMRKLRF
ncbi:uncharacterized protein [Montipora capricornis]|uniref:uncharacterized protein n=1 Tax=Montipora capricornis TaxID=246305 RepID=UPI0035F156B0